MPDGVARPHGLPCGYRPIAAAAVARSLLRAVRQTQGRRVLLSGEMQT